MAAFAGKTAKVKITAATATTSTGEAMSSLSGTTDRFLFRITDKTKRHWTRDTALVPVVYVNTTIHTDFATNFVQGKVTFGTALTTAESAQVTVDARHLTASYLPMTRNWSLDVSVDMLDTTTFSTTTGSVQWRTFTDGLSGATVDLGRINEGGSTAVPAFFDRLNTNTDLIIELIHQPAGTTFKFEAYARVSGDGFATPIDALVEETATLTIDGPLYFATTE